MVTKELIKELRKNKLSYLRIGYKSFNVEVYESYDSMNRNIYTFIQDDVTNINDFINICCPKALSYLLKVNDIIRVVMYKNSYGKESKLFQAGFNYKMVFIQIYRKGQFIMDTLISTEVKEIK